MKQESFEHGISILTSVIPGLNIKPKTWFELLKDLPDEAFIVAINKIAKGVKDIYPTTNIVAMIRELSLPDDRPSLADACDQVWGHLFRSAPAHPLVQKCIRAAGGYNNFNENWDYAMNAFRGIYKDTVEHEVDRLEVPCVEDKSGEVLKQIQSKVMGLIKNVKPEGELV